MINIYMGCLGFILLIACVYYAIRSLLTGSIVGFMLSVIVGLVAYVIMMAGLEGDHYDSLYDEHEVRGKEKKENKNMELPPFKLSDLKETWSGKFVIGMAIVLIMMIVIVIFAGLASR